MPEAPSGNRNLAQKTSKDWSKPYTQFSGAENTCPNLYKVLTNGLVVGDTIKTRIVLKYTDIIPASGKTAEIWTHGSGNVTNWGSGGFPSGTGGRRSLSGSGEMVFELTGTINADHLKNNYWNWRFRTDWIASGSLQWKLAKVEKGTLFTDWSPAPEDLGWTTDTLVPTQTQRYLWKFEYIYYSDGNVEVTDPVNLSIAGQDGIAGKDGVGLKSTVVTYGLSASETTKPITWYDQVPTLTKGQYLWTKTVWTYTDNTTETGYQKTYIARDGNNGNDGIPGKDGVGIKTTTITYAGSTSGTTAPTNGWTSTIPSVPAGQYLWTKTVWTYTDDSSEIGYSVAKMGEDGRAEVRKETFYKLTNSADVPEVPANAHRNLAQRSSSSWSEPYTNFDGGVNKCPQLGKVLTDGMQVGDTVKTRIVLKYDNIVPASGQTAKIQMQGSGNVTNWGSGGFPSGTSSSRSLSGSGEIVFEITDKIKANHLKNAHWNWCFRLDYVASGSIQWKEGKVEIGRNFSPYTPAPEQLGWSTTTIVPTQSNRYLWKFEYVYYSDGSVEVTGPVNLSIAGQDGPPGPPGPQGEDGVIESNGENRIFYGRGDTKKGFFKNATIGTDWNGVPYGEFDDSRLHTTSASNRWVGMTTTEGLKLLGNSGNIPTGKWTLSHDIYITDSMADTTYLQNIIRMHRTDGTYTDLVTIDISARDVGKKPVSIPTNYGRRAIWNPEPDRESYGGRPLINPLEVSIHNNSPVKITTKCVPDEIGNGVAQYTIEPTSSNPTCSFYIWSVTNAIPKDTNKTWTATLKIRANRNCTFSDLGFERFSVMHNVTIKREWQTLYFNGKASGDNGAFILYGLEPQALTSKLVIEIAEVKICDENVPKEIMKDVLLTRYWYRMSSTKTFTDAQRIGLNGSMTGGISVEIPAGKKTDAKVRLRNVSLRRGDVEIPFAPAPEDIYDQNDSKVDQDQLDQIANELRDRQDRLAQELAAKALASEVSELTTQLKNLKESDLAGKADITNAVASLEKRLANVIPLGNMAQKLEFIDSYILQGEEGMEIGNKNSGSKVMITPDRIGFFSGGTEVASFSSGQLRINNGFFADTITVGHFMTRRHPNNQYVNGTYFVK